MSYLNSKFLSGFSPQNIPGLALWLDAADSNSLVFSSGTSVSQWNDKSGNGRNFSQATAGNQPTWSNSFLSRPGVYFNSANSQRLSGTYVQTGTGGRHTYIVFYDSNTPANVYGSPPLMYMADSNSTGAGADWRAAFDASNNYLSIDVFAGAKTMQTSPNVTSMRSRRCIGLWGMPTGATVGTTYVYGNGTQFTTTVASVNLTQTINTFNTSLTTIGGYAPGASWVNAVISEILHYSNELTSNQRQQVEGYLAWKWGITSDLSLATHPYRPAPPFLRPFNPLDVSGLATWFDAADTRRMTLSGSNVNQWGDKANMDNSMNFVGTAGTLVSNSTNYPCVRFSGTSVYQSTLSNLTRANYFSDASTCTMFSVVNTSSGSGVNGLFWNFVSTTNVANRVAIFTNPPSTLFWDAGGIAAPRQTTGLTLTTNSMRLYMFQRAGIVLNFREFGALTSSNVGASTATIANDNYRITMSEAGAAWTGDIHEILWYNRSLPSNDITQVELYLAEKWGLRGSLTANSLMRFYRSLAPVFNPTLFSNCVVWLDAADSSRITESGGVVSLWKDKSPNGLDLSQNTVGSRPTYESNVQNGLSALRFTTTQMLQSTQNFTVDKGQTWFVSFKALAGTNYFFFEQGPNTNTSDGQFLYGGNNSLMYMKRGAATRFIDDPAGRGTSPFALNTWYIGALSTANTTGGTGDTYWSINGTARTAALSGTISGTATNQLYINNTARVPASNYYGEIIIYNQVLSPQQVQLVEDYLAQKWGISLPNNHPYKTIQV